MPTAKSPLVFTVLAGAFALSGAGCATGESSLTSLDSCDDGAASTDPQHYTWRLRLGEARLNQAYEALDEKIDAGFGIQLVYKGRGLRPDGFSDANYTERSSYREVSFDPDTESFVALYNEYMGTRYSYDVLTAGEEGRIEIWRDGFLLDDHLYSCFIKFDGAEIVQNRNENHGAQSPQKLIFDADDFECEENGGLFSGDSAVEEPVITYLELSFETELATHTVQNADIQIDDHSVDPEGARGCRVESPYAYDWYLWVDSFEVNDRLYGQDVDVKLRASVAPDDGPAQVTETMPTRSSVAYDTGEMLGFDPPLQFENIACPSGDPAACATQLTLDVLSDGDSANLYAVNCKITLPVEEILASANVWRTGDSGEIFSSEDAMVDLRANAGLYCGGGDGGIFRDGEPERVALPIRIGFAPVLKPAIGAELLDVPGQGGGGGAEIPPQDDGADSDGDGFSDPSDNCPEDHNPTQGDIDGDGEGDDCDPDDDGDGVEDAADNCPVTANANQLDTDENGEGNPCDRDDDGDGVLDAADNCPLVENADQLNSDGDSFGDRCDDDDDGDTVADADDNCPLDANPDQEDTDGDRIGDACELDDDDDGVSDEADNCPLVSNPDQVNTDGDSQGDACDADDDDDGVLDEDDECPLDPGDGCTGGEGGGEDDGGEGGEGGGEGGGGEEGGGGSPGDADGDGVENAQDNCPLGYNPDQTDVDGDGVGDACDSDDTDGPGGGGGGGGSATDADGDGVPNDSDNCPLVPNADQSDSDLDGEGDACDFDGGDGVPGGGGGGCAAAGGSTLPGGLVLALALGAIRWRRRRARD